MPVPPAITPPPASAPTSSPPLPPSSPGRLATAALADPGLPVVADLLADDVPGPVAAAVSAVGGRATRAELRDVTWWPGRSCTVRWDVVVAGGPLAGDRDLVATTRALPGDAASRALTVAAGNDRVSLWQVPHDPFLPGLPAALDPVVVADVVAGLGGRLDAARTRLRAHRPTRRAVVEVTGDGDPIYLKVVRPDRARRLHDHHVALAECLPVPPSLGVDPARGIVAMGHLPAPTLRRVLEDPGARLPDPGDLVAWATGFPATPGARAVTSSIERVADYADVLAAVVPGQAGRIARLVAALGREEVTDRVPAHGDFHEAQVLVDDGRLVGLVDVDGVGLARPGDDLATLLGHLTVWERLSHHPRRVRAYGRAVLERADAVHDPADLRRRAAAVVVGLATGPFRVQQATWPDETVRRLELAESWLASATRVAGGREATLIPVTGPAHRRPPPS